MKTSGSRRASTGGSPGGNMGEYSKCVGRAEMLRAMDCLMHHLSDADGLSRWKELALPDDLDWHLLGGRSGRDLEYLEKAGDMTDNEFACVVKTFADIVRWQCFDSVFNNQAFTIDGETNGNLHSDKN